MSKLGVHSLKTQFVLAAALIVAFFAVALGTAIVREERSHLRKNLEGTGRILMSALKAPIINTMILGEMGVQPGLLDNYVDEIALNEDLHTVYAYITDEKGKVLAHNRPEESGSYYRDPLTMAALAHDGYRSREIGGGDKKILDMALPLRVSGKCWGALRVGLSMAPTEAASRRAEMEVASAALVVFLVGTGIFYILGCSMARPLIRLSRSMGGVDMGVFDSAPLSPRQDEIGVLQKSFHDMLGRLKRSEQERQATRDYLIQNEKMVSIGKIVAGVAHEINNPLAAITACLYKMEGRVHPEAQNSLEILKGTIPRIQTIVRQLSDFSRSGTLELQHVASDQFLQEAINFARMALRKYQITLTVEDACTPPVTMRIDRGRLHQVVLNLLLNAASASRFEGELVLRCAVREGNYLLEVVDHGEGIPPQNLEKIFDIFFTTKPAGQGSGIGLAVCKSIVLLHRGSISAASRAGETTFSVAIPLEKGEG